MHFDDGNKCEVSSSDIVRPENLSKGQLAQNQSQEEQRDNKQISPTLFFNQQKPSENSEATAGLGHCTRNVEERFRW